MDHPRVRPGCARGAGAGGGPAAVGRRVGAVDRERPAWRARRSGPRAAGSEDPLRTRAERWGRYTKLLASEFSQTLRHADLPAEPSVAWRPQRCGRGWCGLTRACPISGCRCRCGSAHFGRRRGDSDLTASFGARRPSGPNGLRVAAVTLLRRDRGSGHAEFNVALAVSASAPSQRPGRTSSACRKTSCTKGLQIGGPTGWPCRPRMS